MTIQPDSDKERDHDEYYWPVGDFVGGILFMAMALFFIIGGLRMPTRGASGFVTAAGFTPVVLGTVVFLLNLILVYLVLKTYGYRSIIGWVKGCIQDEIARRWSILTLIIGGYVFMVGRVNFVFANAIFFAVVFTYLRAGNWWQIVFYTVLSSAIVGIIVPWIFAMPMP